MKRLLKLILLLMPWSVIWLLGVSCALISDGFGCAQDWLARIAMELDQEIQRL